MVSVTQDGFDAVTIKAAGELCFDTAAPVAAVLATAMSAGAQRVILDLDQVTMLSWEGCVCWWQRRRSSATAAGRCR